MMDGILLAGATTILFILFLLIYIRIDAYIVVVVGRLVLDFYGLEDLNYFNISLWSHVTYLMRLEATYY